MAYWVDSRYDDQCSECEQDIRVGDRVLLDQGKRYCSECGVDVRPDPLNGAGSSAVANFLRGRKL
jgi:hypothetical protein